MGPSGVSRRRASVAAAETVAPAVAAAAVAPSPQARWRRWLGTCVCVSTHHFRVSVTTATTLSYQHRLTISRGPTAPVLSHGADMLCRLPRTPKRLGETQE
jgi:hypothetical protein